ncbi:MAG: TIM barrel protein [Ignisphaera sp.]|uniref:Xylose isomerase-like TIM barrel domain-containing protein n=1 Tax=Ignisphaera aggregans TaxID=334771 RepID=A0A7C4NSP5_9CREN
MFTPSKLYFGTAGIPNSTSKKSTINGIKRIIELGLDSMEIEFVRGIRMSEKSAEEVRNTAQQLGVLLTVHAPYYINLNSSESSKIEASIQRIVESAKLGYIAGAWSVVFHSGYYGESASEEAYRNVKGALKVVINTLKDIGVEIWIRPEVMGGISEIGSLEEIIRLSEDLDDYIMPCIDFAHLHARSNGKYNTYEEFTQILELLEKRLGRIALDTMHIHVSGIEYGEKGEIKHLNLIESDLNYKDLIKALKEFSIKGVIISESPNLEEDAILIKNIYMNL